jgi:methyltransferase-like protein
MEQQTNVTFCFNLCKMPKEIYEMLQTVCGDDVLSYSRVYDFLNDLKAGMRIFRIIQEAGVLQHNEMQTQLQMSTN